MNHGLGRLARLPNVLPPFVPERQLSRVGRGRSTCELMSIELLLCVESVLFGAEKVLARRSDVR